MERPSIIHTVPEYDRAWRTKIIIQKIVEIKKNEMLGIKM